MRPRDSGVVKRCLEGSETEMITPQRLNDLLALIRELSDRMADARLAAFVADLPASAREPRQCRPRPLPVLRHLEAARRASRPASRPLLDCVSGCADALFWGQTYSVADFGAAFLESYGWTELVGLRGPIPSRSIACGVLLLGPDTQYPLHAHRAEEVYVVLSGTASWKSGVSDWTERHPPQVIHHPGDTPHAMKTGDEPLAALYLWRDGDLTEKSSFGPALAP
jgi:mannose-6-phosphate isomerase-like protein (cupin superfamily)